LVAKNDKYIVKEKIQ